MNVTLGAKKNNDFVRSQADFILQKEQEDVRLCSGSNHTILAAVWFSYQFRGMIADKIPFPLTRNQCKTITVQDFSDIVQIAMDNSKGQFSPAEQKRQHLVKMYGQVPLADRLAVKRIFEKDFQMFGYDPKPSVVFAEIS